MIDFRKSLFFFAFLLSVHGMSASALATKYECRTKNDYRWNAKENALTHETSRASKNHAVIAFDDESGILVWAFDEESPHNPIKMEVLQKLNSSDMLLARRLVNIGNPGASFAYTNEFRIFKNSFFYNASSDFEIMTGTCQEGIDDKNFQWMLDQGKNYIDRMEQKKNSGNNHD